MTALLGVLLTHVPAGAGLSPVVLLALLFAPPTCPETSAPERPLLFQKEAVQKAVFGNCFLAGTLVVAGHPRSDGKVERVLREVQEVKADDLVLAQDPVTGEVGYRRVVRTFENLTTSVVSVTVGAPECLPLRQSGRGERRAVGQAGSGEEGGEDAEPPSASQTIRCTPCHPWRVRDADGALRWVFAGDLRVGDRLVPEAGPEQVVLALDVREEVARTFNFEVEGWHTYYVSGAAGQPGVLVHNKSWIRPKNWRLPSKRYGRWSNPKNVGTSDFVLNSKTARSLGLPTGTRIPFKEGTPDFQRFSFGKRNFRVQGLTGSHAEDMPHIARVMSKRWGISQADYYRWLESANLTPHHFRGTQIQFVRRDIHETIRHSGSAVVQRGGP